jgi:hypothetical protein
MIYSLLICVLIIFYTYQHFFLLRFIKGSDLKVIKFCHFQKEKFKSKTINDVMSVLCL